MKHEWRAKIMRDLWAVIENDEYDDMTDEQTDAIDTIIEETAEQLCQVAGHEPTRDHCGMPEHDHCLWCRASLPNSWVKDSWT